MKCLSSVRIYGSKESREEGCLRRAFGLLFKDIELFMYINFQEMA